MKETGKYDEDKMMISEKWLMAFGCGCSHAVSPPYSNKGKPLVERAEDEHGKH
jgi:hypothetical protein